MMRTSTLLIVIFSTLLQSSHAQSGPERSLFNGRDLSGWKKMGNFTALVETGELVLADGDPRGGSWLLSNETFQNFHLAAEFSIASAGRSAIAIRYDDQRPGDPAAMGYAITLHHDPDQQNPTGSIFNVARATWQDDLNPEGWNRLEVTADGDHLKVLLNGKLVCETHNRRSAAGRVALQAPAAASIRFRKVTLTPGPDRHYSGPLLEDYLRHTARRPLEPLFDGQSLAGWHPTGDGEWTIENGVIHGYSGVEGGFLVSDRSYQNFYLRLKFRIAEEDNSGVFIRTDPSAPVINLETGIECNIYDHNGPAHVFSTGAIAGYARAWHHVIDYSDWNLMEVFAFGDQVCLLVNGVKTAEAHLPAKFNRPGRICLQGGIQIFSDAKGPSHVYFKDILIRDMEGVPFVGY